MSEFTPELYADDIRLGQLARSLGVRALNFMRPSRSFKKVFSEIEYDSHLDAQPLDYVAGTSEETELSAAA